MEVGMFLGKLNRIDIANYFLQNYFSGTSVTRFRYRITLERPAISTGGHRMGFTPCESDHADCGGVYISANPITLSA